MGRKPLTQEQVIQNLKKFNMRPLEPYVNRTTHMKTLCLACGHKWMRVAHPSGGGCPECAKEKRRRLSGSNKGKSTPVVTSENRLLSVWEINDPICQNVPVVEALIQARLDRLDRQNDETFINTRIPSLLARRFLLLAINAPENRNKVTSIDPNSFIMKRAVWNDLMSRTFGYLQNSAEMYRRGGLMVVMKEQGVLNWSYKASQPTISIGFPNIEQIYLKVLKDTFDLEGDSQPVKEIRAGLDFIVPSTKLDLLYPNCRTHAKRKQSKDLSTNMRYRMIEHYMMWATGGFDVNPQHNKQARLKGSLAAGSVGITEYNLDRHNDFRTYARSVKTMAERLGVNVSVLYEVIKNAKLFTTVRQGEEIAKNISGSYGHKIQRVARRQGKGQVRIVETPKSKAQRKRQQKEKRLQGKKRYNLYREIVALRKPRKHTPWFVRIKPWYHINTWTKTTLPKTTKPTITDSFKTILKTVKTPYGTKRPYLLHFRTTDQWYSPSLTIHLLWGDSKWVNTGRWKRVVRIPKQRFKGVPAMW